MAHYYVSASRENLHGVFDPELPPILEVESGDIVSFETLEVGWRTSRISADGNASRLQPHNPELDNGPALTSPIAIKGAEPGMLLEIKVLHLEPGDWGWNSAPPFLGSRLVDGLGCTGRVGVYWDIEGAWARNQWGHKVKTAPFPGTLGIAPAGGRVDGWTPRQRTGGNLDLKLLTAGASLFLPVEVAGALVSVGDCHAAQGDGEVGGTAIECPMKEVRLSFHLRDGRSHSHAWVENGSLLISYGLGTTLDEAAAVALEIMVDLLAIRFARSSEELIALCSVLCDLRITQTVNPRVGVHAVFDLSSLGGFEPGK